MTNQKIKAISGFAICALAAVLMLGDVVSVEWGAAIGIIGVGLIAAAAAGSSDA